MIGRASEYRDLVTFPRAISGRARIGDGIGRFLRPGPSEFLEIVFSKVEAAGRPQCTQFRLLAAQFRPLDFAGDGFGAVAPAFQGVKRQLRACLAQPGDLMLKCFSPSCIPSQYMVDRWPTG